MRRISRFSLLYQNQIQLISGVRKCVMKFISDFNEQLSVAKEAIVHSGNRTCVPIFSAKVWLFQNSGQMKYRHLCRSVCIKRPQPCRNRLSRRKFCLRQTGYRLQKTVVLLEKYLLRRSAPGSLPVVSSVQICVKRTLYYSIL
ncbi:hypothetical protein ETA_09480 [Erwinia tasmaniensis Et1/99]|uniref:Uncharacterized protein n=1 Tax=Erwinia tasmaniensis (strain DSM 17950 / CFBP 7177 / CIP 109463 / NCPPB 4357 / Et1/99) TaxID=465817 RepID=B2VDV7_ERWT9|nr:hypothetical protein ETA_09480 [Erwinia tasmaniensis Et1/99]